MVKRMSKRFAAAQTHQLLVKCRRFGNNDDHDRVAHPPLRSNLERTDFPPQLPTGLATQSAERLDVFDLAGLDVSHRLTGTPQLANELVKESLLGRGHLDIFRVAGCAGATVSCCVCAT